MKKVLILFTFIFLTSCKSETAREKEELFEKLRSEFPLTITNSTIEKNGTRFDLKITGYIENKSEHFLNTLYIDPDINYERLAEDGAKIVFLDKFEIVKSGTFDSKTTLHFSETIAFPHDFNPDEFKYEIKHSILELEMSGENSTGYKFNSAPGWGAAVHSYGFDFGSLVSYDLTQEWKKFINN